MVVVNNDKIESFLRPLYPRLYSFCHSLIPDELQAQQLVVDAISVFLIKEKDFVLQIESNSFGSEKQERLFSHRLLRILLRYTYELGLRRLGQLQALVKTSLQELPFYHLEGKERVVLYLRYNLKLSWDDIEFITKIGRAQLINISFLAEQKLLDEKRAMNLVSRPVF